MSTQDKSDERISLEGMSGGPRLAGQANFGPDNREMIVNFFTSIPLFSLLNADEVAQVLRICSIETVGPGETIFAEGDAAQSMIIIEHGEVTVTKHLQGSNVHIASLGDGSIIGEMALIAGSPRSATVKTLSETRLYRLNGRNFDDLRRKRSLAAYKIIQKLLETLGERHQRVLQRIDELFANPEDHTEVFESRCRDLIDRAKRALDPNQD